MAGFFFFFFPEDYQEESVYESPLDFGGLLTNKKKNLLDYGCFTMLCYFLLYSKVSQVHICIYPLIFGFLSVLGHHGALSKFLLCSQF